MRGKRAYLALLICLAVLGALVVTAAAVPRIGGLAWAGVALSAAGALAVAFGRKVIDAVSERPTAALKNFLDRDEALRAIPGFRRLVRESTSRITLDIHPAIPLPTDHPAGLSDEFPLYVPRDIDAHLRGWIRGHAGDGGLVLLVGPAASGKTRSLSAALQAELPGWQFLMPTSVQLNALVAARADLAHSVIWLNELQDFFIGEAESWGLKAAALGIPGAMHNLGLLYEERGEVAAALTWYRRGAERGYTDVQAGRGGVDPWPGESRDGGISNTILCLAELLERTGQIAEAEHWYRRGAELGDARAAAPWPRCSPAAATRPPPFPGEPRRRCWPGPT